MVMRIMWWEGGEAGGDGGRGVHSSEWSSGSCASGIRGAAGGDVMVEAGFGVWGWGQTGMGVVVKEDKSKTRATTKRIGAHLPFVFPTYRAAHLCIVDRRFVDSAIVFASFLCAFVRSSAPRVSRALNGECSASPAEAGSFLTLLAQAQALALAQALVLAQMSAR